MLYRHRCLCLFDVWLIDFLILLIVYHLAEVTVKLLISHHFTVLNDCIRFLIVKKLGTLKFLFIDVVNITVVPLAFFELGHLCL